MPDISIDRTTYIKIGNSDPLTTGIAEGTMLIDRVLFAQDFLFGQFASSMFEIQIYGIANVAGQKIEVYQLENNVRTDLFVGQVESSKLDNAGYYRDIIAFDKFYFISKKNVADWFNGLWTNITEISVLDAYKSLLAHFDIDYDPNTVTATNFSGTLHKDSVVSFEKISFKDMVKYLLEPLGLIPYINESGKGAVFSPSMANAVDLSGKYDVNQSVFEEFTVKPMQWVGIQNIDSAVLQQTEITGNTSDIRYDLPYNPIRLDLYVEDGETARTAVLTNFTNKANFTEYKPCEVFMIVSDMSIKLGDQITTTRGTAYVSEIILSGPMLVEQQLISRGSQVQQEVEEEYDPVFAYLDNRITETADDLQQQLDDFEPSEEYLEKVGEFSDTIAGGMGLQVITYKAQDGSLLKYFYAPPPAGSAVTGISGSNFIFTMKSTGFAWTNKWEGAPDASSESHVDPGTGDTISTQWTSGISADGNALLKILNAYKVSADILEGGELVIKDQQGKIIHKFSYDDYSAQMGGPNGISYNASTGKTTIGSDVDILGTVTIGGGATIGETITNEVNDAVEALDIKGIDHETVNYQVGTSATTIPTGTWLSDPPSVSAGQYLWTRKITYYSDGTDNSDAPLYTVVKQPGIVGTSAYYAIGTSATSYANEDLVTLSGTSTKWVNTIPDTTNYRNGSTRYYLWTRKGITYTKSTTGNVASYSYTVAPIPSDGAPGTPGTNGTDGTSSYVYVRYSEYADGTDFVTSPTSSTKYIGIYVGNSSSVPTGKGSYTWSKYVGNDGAKGTPGTNGIDGTSEYVHFAYATSADGSANFSTSSFNGATYLGICHDDDEDDPTGADAYTQYTWTKIKGEDGQGIDHTVINYGIGTSSTDSSTVSSWVSTPPDVSSNKGKYLWTRTQIYYTTAPSVVGNTSYSVSYIAANGSAGRGIYSITQYYYASTSDQSSSLPAQMSGTSVNTAWKTLPSDLSNKFSETNKYLWTFVRTIYTESNGSTTGSNGSPYIVGTWGEKGDPGSGGSGTTGRGIRNVEKQYILKDQDGNPRSVDGTPTTWSTEPPEYAGNEETEQTVTQSLTFSNAPGKPSSDSSAWSTVAKIQFIPPVTAQYVFASNAQESGSYLDTYGYLFNSSGSLIDSNDDGVSSSSRQFKITATLDAGTTYYLGAAFYSSTNAGKTIPATITYTEKTTKTYDYWERDVFTWTAAPITTYVPSESGVKSAGVSVAIRAVNELNADYAHLIIKPKDTTYIDGAKIYTGSVTASDIAAYNALIKNLMANYVEVDGSVDVTNGDITITQEPTESGNIPDSYLNSYCQSHYGKSYSQLSPFVQPFVLMQALGAYVASQAVAAANAGKLTVKNNAETIIAALYPNALVFTDSTNGKYSLIGNDSTFGGNVKVGGSLTAGNIQKGTGSTYIAKKANSASTAITSEYNNGTWTPSFVEVNFDTAFSNVPVVVVTPTVQYDQDIGYGYIACIREITTTGFKFYIVDHNWNGGSYGSVSYNWIAIS